MRFVVTPKNLRGGVPGAYYVCECLYANEGLASDVARADEDGDVRFVASLPFDTAKGSRTGSTTLVVNLYAMSDPRGRGKAKIGSVAMDASNYAANPAPRFLSIRTPDGVVCSVGVAKGDDGPKGSSPSPPLSPTSRQGISSASTANNSGSASMRFADPYTGPPKYRGDDSDEEAGGSNFGGKRPATRRTDIEVDDIIDQLVDSRGARGGGASPSASASAADAPSGRRGMVASYASPSSRGAPPTSPRAGGASPSVPSRAPPSPSSASRTGGPTSLPPSLPRSSGQGPSSSGGMPAVPGRAPPVSPRAGGGGMPSVPPSPSSRGTTSSAGGPPSGMPRVPSAIPRSSSGMPSAPPSPSSSDRKPSAMAPYPHHDPLPPGVAVPISPRIGSNAIPTTPTSYGRAPSALPAAPLVSPRSRPSGDGAPMTPRQGAPMTPRRAAADAPQSPMAARGRRGSSSSSSSDSSDDDAARRRRNSSSAGRRPSQVGAPPSAPPLSPRGGPRMDAGGPSSSTATPPTPPSPTSRSKSPPRGGPSAASGSTPPPPQPPNRQSTPQRERDRSAIASASSDAPPPARPPAPAAAPTSRSSSPVRSAAPSSPTAGGGSPLGRAAGESASAPPPTPPIRGVSTAAAAPSSPTASTSKRPSYLDFAPMPVSPRAGSVSAAPVTPRGASASASVPYGRDAPPSPTSSAAPYAAPQSPTERSVDRPAPPQVPSASASASAPPTSAPPTQHRPPTTVPAVAVTSMPAPPTAAPLSPRARSASPPREREAPEASSPPPALRKTPPPQPEMAATGRESPAPAPSSAAAYAPPSSAPKRSQSPTSPTSRAAPDTTDSPLRRRDGFESPSRSAPAPAPAAAPTRPSAPSTPTSRSTSPSQQQQQQQSAYGSPSAYNNNIQKNTPTPTPTNGGPCSNSDERRDRLVGLLSGSVTQAKKKETRAVYAQTDRIPDPPPRIVEKYVPRTERDFIQIRVKEFVSEDELAFIVQDHVAQTVRNRIHRAAHLIARDASRPKGRTAAATAAKAAPPQQQQQQQGNGRSSTVTNANGAAGEEEEEARPLLPDELLALAAAELYDGLGVAFPKAPLHCAMLLREVMATFFYDVFMACTPVVAGCWVNVLAVLVQSLNDLLDGSIEVAPPQPQRSPSPSDNSRSPSPSSSPSFSSNRYAAAAPNPKEFFRSHNGAGRCGGVPIRDDVLRPLEVRRLTDALHDVLQLCAEYVLSLDDIEIDGEEPPLRRSGKGGDQLLRFLRSNIVSLATPPGSKDIFANWGADFETVGTDAHDPSGARARAAATKAKGGAVQKAKKSAAKAAARAEKQRRKAAQREERKAVKARAKEERRAARRQQREAERQRQRQQRQAQKGYGRLNREKEGRRQQAMAAANGKKPLDRDYDNSEEDDEDSFYAPPPMQSRFTSGPMRRAEFLELQKSIRGGAYREEDYDDYVGEEDEEEVEDDYASDYSAPTSSESESEPESSSDDDDDDDVDEDDEFEVDEDPRYAKPQQQQQPPPEKSPYAPEVAMARWRLVVQQCFLFALTCLVKGVPDQPSPLLTAVTAVIDANIFPSRTPPVTSEQWLASPTAFSGFTQMNWAGMRNDGVFVSPLLHDAGITGGGGGGGATGENFTVNGLPAVPVVVRFDARTESEKRLRMQLSPAKLFSPDMSGGGLTQGANPNSLIVSDTATAMVLYHLDMLYMALGNDGATSGGAAPSADGENASFSTPLSPSAASASAFTYAVLGETARRMRSHLELMRRVLQEAVFSAAFEAICTVLMNRIPQLMEMRACIDLGLDGGGGGPSSAGSLGGGDDEDDPSIIRMINLRVKTAHEAMKVKLQLSVFEKWLQERGLYTAVVLGGAGGLNANERMPIVVQRSGSPAPHPSSSASGGGAPVLPPFTKSAVLFSTVRQYCDLVIIPKRQLRNNDKCEEYTGLLDPLLVYHLLTQYESSHTHTAKGPAHDALVQSDTPPKEVILKFAVAAYNRLAAAKRAGGGGGAGLRDSTSSSATQSSVYASTTGGGQTQITRELRLATSMPTRTVSPIADSAIKHLRRFLTAVHPNMPSAVWPMDEDDGDAEEATEYDANGFPIEGRGEDDAQRLKKKRKDAAKELVFIASWDLPQAEVERACQREGWRDNRGGAQGALHRWLTKGKK